MTNIKEKIGLALVSAMLLTNPVTSQFVELTIEKVFNRLVMVGAYVTLAAGIYAVGYMAWNIWDSRERVNIPKHSKGKAGKYILTQ